MRTGVQPAGIQLEGQRGAVVGASGQGDRGLDAGRALLRRRRDDAAEGEIIGGADGTTEIVVAESAAKEPAGDEETASLSQRLLASGDFSTASALAFLVFILLYVPCIATVVAIGSEAGWKWAAASVVYNTAMAWLVAWIVYRIVLLF